MICLKDAKILDLSKVGLEVGDTVFSYPDLYVVHDLLEIIGKRFLHLSHLGRHSYPVHLSVHPLYSVYRVSPELMKVVHDLSKAEKLRKKAVKQLHELKTVKDEQEPK